MVDETADIEKAAKDIVDGCSFDNNLPCIAEKEVIAVDSVADYLIFNMKKNGAYEVKDPAVISQLVELVTKEGKSPKTEFVGKSAKYILDKIGISVGDDVKVIPHGDQGGSPLRAGRADDAHPASGAGSRRGSGH